MSLAFAQQNHPDSSFESLKLEQFRGASKFSEDISGWSLGSLEHADSAFAGAAIFSHSLCDWASQLSQQTTVRNMFKDSGCPVTDDPDLVAGSPFCHRCGDDASVFYSTEQLYEAADEYMEYLLSNANGTPPVLEKYGPIESWDVHLISDFSRLFDVDRKAGFDLWETDNECPLTTEQLTWNMSSARSLRGMFLKCTQFLGNGLESWDTSSAEDLSYMFAGATEFKGNGLRNFDVSNVQNLETFLDSSGFNPEDDQELADWNISSCTNLDWAFYGTEFDGNISAWQTSNVETFV